ncbi:DeoR/GlpR family DNA-binding transcription regulator [Spirochaeta dissipatitropha]
MFAIERIRIIKEYILEHEKVEVPALSSLLSVSEVTVRRDLMKLENDGFLTRTHGGAVLNQISKAPLVNTPSQGSDADEISELALIGCRMISDRSIVMLLDGEVNKRIAEKLSARQSVTVLTNDLRIAGIVGQQIQNKAVLLGGDVEGSSVYGSITLEHLQRYYVQQLFYQVDGINTALQFSVDSQQKADLIRAASEHADSSTVVCTRAAFGSNAFYRFGDINSATSLIAHPGIDDDFKSRIFNSSAALYTAIDVFEGRETVSHRGEEST